MKANKENQLRVKASFTIEAAITVGFILCFLSLSISYELQQVYRILGKITIQREEQLKWSVEDDIRNYLIFKECLDVVDQISNAKEDVSQ